MLLKVTNEDGSLNLGCSGSFEPFDEDHKTAGYLKTPDTLWGNNLRNPEDSGVYHLLVNEQAQTLTGTDLTGYYTVYALENSFGFKIYLGPLELTGSVADNNFKNKPSKAPNGVEINNPAYIKETLIESLTLVYNYLADLQVENSTWEQGSEPVRTVTRIYYENQHGGSTMEPRTIDGNQIYAGSTISSDVNDPSEDPPQTTSSCNKDSAIPVKSIQTNDTLGATVGTGDGEIDFTDRTKKYWVIREEVEIKSWGEDVEGIADVSVRNADQLEYSKDQLQTALDLPNYDEWDWWLQARYPFKEPTLFYEEAQPTLTVTGNGIFEPYTVTYFCGQLTQAEWLACSVRGKRFITNGMSTTEEDLGVFTAENVFVDSSGNPYPPGSDAAFPKPVSPWASTGGRMTDFSMALYFAIGDENWRASVGSPNHNTLNIKTLLNGGEMSGDRFIKFNPSFSRKKEWGSAGGV